jgi:hypothetical protein
VEPLVGREAELEAVREGIAGAAGRGMILEGQAGTGLSHAALGDLLAPLVEDLPGDMPAAQRHALEVVLAASELFVSVRTVEANLTRVYAKLGIRSRTELAAIRRASNGRSRSPAPQPAPPS